MEKGTVQAKRQLYVCCPACGKMMMIAAYADAQIKHACGKMIHVISDGNSVNTTIIENETQIEVEQCDKESQKKRIGAYKEKISELNAG